MVRQGRAGCACVLLLAAGCVPDAGFLSAGLAPAPGHLVPGSVETVSVAAQSALSRMGLFVRTGRDGGTVRLSSTTASGKHFTLVLERQKSGRGVPEAETSEGTLIRVEWVKDADEGFWIEFVSALTQAQPGAAGLPTAGIPASKVRE